VRRKAISIVFSMTTSRSVEDVVLATVLLLPTARYD
jgi:hypothetical protein